jgi:hypothetical protein
MIPIWFSISLSIASIIGGVINARGRIEGFYVWMVGSGVWGALCLCEPSMLGQLPMWVANFLISVYGVKMWGKNPSPDSRGPPDVNHEGTSDSENMLTESVSQT